MNTHPSQEAVQKAIETLRVKMRVGCDCVRCREDNQNMEEGCVVRQVLTTYAQTISEREKEQSDYNVSMAVQAIDFYLSKDGEEYGVTPLHQKLHAYISRGQWWKHPTPTTNHTGE